MSKTAKLREHKVLEYDVRLESGHGVLPSVCSCGGALDFKRVDNKTILVCRLCEKRYDS